MKISAAALLASSLLHVRFTSWSCELPVNAQLPDRPHIHFELVDRGGGMLYKEYLETARTLHRAALKMTDRMIAGQLRAVAEDCERRAEKAAQADTAKAPALGGLNSSFPKSRSKARSQAARAAQLAERTLGKIEDPAAPPQERAQRKRKLTIGPHEFREYRIDQPEEYSSVDLRPVI